MTKLKIQGTSFVRFCNSSRKASDHRTRQTVGCCAPKDEGGDVDANSVLSSAREEGQKSVVVLSARARNSGKHNLSLGAREKMAATAATREVVCNGCSTLLRFPAGAQVVRCVLCSQITPTPQPDPNRPPDHQARPSKSPLSTSRFPSPKNCPIPTTASSSPSRHKVREADRKLQPFARKRHVDVALDLWRLPHGSTVPHGS